MKAKITYFAPNGAVLTYNVEDYIIKNTIIRFYDLINKVWRTLPIDRCQIQEVA